MKAKNLTRILFFAVLLCTMALLCVNAQATTEGAKIIRFDADGSVIINPDNTVQTTVKRVDMLSKNVLNSTAAQPKFAIPAEEQFNLADYPFVKIKMRTNFPDTIQFYASITGGTGSRSDISNTSIISNGAWHTVELKFEASKTINYAATDGRTWHSVSGATLPTIKDPIFQFKGSKSTPSHDYYAEIEYIAFFSTEEAMKAYDLQADSIVLRFDGHTDRVISAPSKADESISNGAFRVETATDDYTTTHFTVSNPFNLYEYPYVKLKFKNNWPNNFQFYMVHSNTNLTSAGGYYYAQPNKDNAIVKDAWNTAELYFPDGKVVTGNTNTYTDANGTIWKTYWDSNAKDFPTEDDPSPVYDIFFQYKEKTDDLSYYGEVDYIAYFKTAEAMNAHTARQAAIEAAATEIAADSYTFTMHPTTDENSVANYVATTIENEYENVCVSVVSSVISDDANSCAVTLTLIDNTADAKAVAYTTVTVALTYLPEITLTTLGAQIRPVSDGEIPADLRFGVLVDYDETVYTNVTYGMVIIPSAYFSTSYTLEIPAATVASPYTGNLSYKENGSTKYYKAVNIVAENKAVTDDGIRFNAVITDIPYTDEDTNEYDTKIMARPYITYTVNGETFTYYGEVITRSVNDVISAAAEWDK